MPTFFRVGCDIVETNTFGGTSLVLGEFDLRDKVREINLKAAQLAREVAQQFSTKDKPRFVAGSMGPTTKLPSLGHIRWDAMLESYEEQASALIEGGVDVLLIETCQDLLQAKIATVAVFEVMRKAGKRLPVTVQVTLQESGTMLLGTEIGAALTALEPYDVDIIGLNCATGPAEMNEAVRYLGLNSTKHISVLPNAGLPQNVGGHAVYKLAPKDLADYHKHFVQDYGVRIVGGCCGTTPEHLQAVVDAVTGVEPAKRDVKPVSAASSAFTSVPLDLEPKPLIVAEEMNTTTRVDHFRKLVQARKYDDILRLAKKLANEGSHMFDLCCAIVGEDEKDYISAILEKIATRVPAPILIDSTEADVVEEALKRIPGKAIINSINLEDGEKRTSKVLPMAKRYGAGVIALTIDEEGMALTADKKVAIAHRIFDLATQKYGIRPVVLEPLQQQRLPRLGQHVRAVVGRAAIHSQTHRASRPPQRQHRSASRAQTHVGCGAVRDAHAGAAQPGHFAAVEEDAVRQPGVAVEPFDFFQEVERPPAEAAQAVILLIAGLGQVRVQAHTVAAGQFRAVAHQLRRDRERRAGRQRDAQHGARRWVVVLPDEPLAIGQNLLFGLHHRIRRQPALARAHAHAAARGVEADADAARRLDLRVDQVVLPLREDIVMVGGGGATRKHQLRHARQRGGMHRLFIQPRPDGIQRAQPVEQLRRRRPRRRRASASGRDDGACSPGPGMATAWLPSISRSRLRQAACCRCLPAGFRRLRHTGIRRAARGRPHPWSPACGCCG